MLLCCVGGVSGGRVCVCGVLMEEEEKGVRNYGDGFAE